MALDNGENHYTTFMYLLKASDAINYFLLLAKLNYMALQKMI